MLRCCISDEKNCQILTALAKLLAWKEIIFPHNISTCKLNYNINNAKQCKCCDAVSQMKRIVRILTALAKLLAWKEITSPHIISTCKLYYNISNAKQCKCCDAISQTKELLNSHRLAKPLAWRRNNTSAYWRHMQAPMMTVSNMHKFQICRNFALLLKSRCIYFPVL